MWGKTVFFLLSLILSLSAINPFKTLPEVEGVVDDCCCEVSAVNTFSSNIFPLLNKLVKKTYFKYFKINYLRECPFWAENAICSLNSATSGSCGVCECDENEIPEPWKREEIEKKKSRVDATLDGPFLNWEEVSDDVWIRQRDDEETYVNLDLNPERYTGYGGFNATRIWTVIYQENCFSGQSCLEERVFLRLISGFHASTTTHIFGYFKQANGDWEENLDLYVHRLAYFPDRIKNIYFSFLFLLRAVEKAKDTLLKYDYHTGNEKEDKETKDLIRQFYQESSQALPSCKPLFDEAKMFKGPKMALKKEFKTKFRNISEIMDCVNCETCKVHAKLQILGIGTALKILLDDSPTVLRNLQRNEIIALFNTLQKYSDSIQILLRARESYDYKQLKYWLTILVMIVLAGASSSILVIVCYRRKNKEKSS